MRGPTTEEKGSDGPSDPPGGAFGRRSPVPWCRVEDLLPSRHDHVVAIDARRCRTKPAPNEVEHEALGGRRGLTTRAERAFDRPDRSIFSPMLRCQPAL